MEPPANNLAEVRTVSLVRACLMAALSLEDGRTLRGAPPPATNLTEARDIHAGGHIDPLCVPERPVMRSALATAKSEQEKCSSWSDRWFMPAGHSAPGGVCSSLGDKKEPANLWGEPTFPGLNGMLRKKISLPLRSVSPRWAAGVLPELAPWTPLLFVLTPGVHPLHEVEELGRSLGRTAEEGLLTAISLGQ
eukprot:9143854-Pyramimonas_sp.AAC.3